MVKVKICGITNLDDARRAVDAGADALGFNFYPKTPRYVDPEISHRIVTELPPFVTTVGIFVNEPEEKVHRIIRSSGIQVLQFHGEESPEYCERFHLKAIKAFRIREAFDLAHLGAYEADAFLLDAYVAGAYGGTGKTFNWETARKAKTYGRIILAGGLTPENVKRAVAEVQPYAVDVSSGVERAPGKKDHRKMRAFVEQAKG